MLNNLTGTILAVAVRMRSCLIYYRTLAIPLTAISLICALQVLQAGSGYFVFRVLWVKVLTSIVIGCYIAIFRTQDIVFYNNLGVSRAGLFVFSFVFDFLIWLLLMTITVALIS